SPHRGARDAHAALLSLRAGPRSSTLQTAKTLEGLSASELSASGVFRLSSAAPAARAAAAVQCERAGGARRRLERAGAQKPKACWAVRGGDEAGGEGERNRTAFGRFADLQSRENDEKLSEPRGSLRKTQGQKGDCR
ncbi:unnamed protein product, partial [Prorocentrum cordatum]